MSAHCGHPWFLGKAKDNAGSDRRSRSLPAPALFREPPLYLCLLELMSAPKWQRAQISRRLFNSETSASFGGSGCQPLIRDRKRHHVQTTD
jgi:hypothetical protein